MWPYFLYYPFGETYSMITLVSLNLKLKNGHKLTLKSLLTATKQTFFGLKWKIWSYTFFVLVLTMALILPQLKVIINFVLLLIMMMHRFSFYDISLLSVCLITLPLFYLSDHSIFSVCLITLSFLSLCLSELSLLSVCLSVCLISPSLVCLFVWSLPLLSVWLHFFVCLYALSFLSICMLSLFCLSDLSLLLLFVWSLSLACLSNLFILSVSLIPL